MTNYINGYLKFAFGTGNEKQQRPVMPQAHSLNRSPYAVSAKATSRKPVTPQDIVKQKQQEYVNNMMTNITNWRKGVTQSLRQGVIPQPLSKMSAGTDLKQLTDSGTVTGMEAAKVKANSVSSRPENVYETTVSPSAVSKFEPSDAKLVKQNSALIACNLLVNKKSTAPTVSKSAKWYHKPIDLVLGLSEEDRRALQTYKGLDENKKRMFRSVMDNGGEIDVNKILESQPNLLENIDVGSIIKKNPDLLQNIDVGSIVGQNPELLKSYVSNIDPGTLEGLFRGLSPMQKKTITDTYINSQGGMGSIIGGYLTDMLDNFFSDMGKDIGGLFNGGTQQQQSQQPVNTDTAYNQTTTPGTYASNNALKRTFPTSGYNTNSGFGGSNYADNSPSSINNNSNGYGGSNYNFSKG